MERRRLALHWLILIGCLVSLAASSATVTEESLAERRKRVEEMSDSQREDLLRRVDQFRKLGSEERDRLIELHRRIQASPESDKLHDTLRHYCHWLATLSAIRRAELVGLEPAERVKRIKELLREQAKSGNRRLGDKDREAIARWIDQYATNHEKNVIDPFSEGRRRPQGKNAPAARHRGAIWVLCQRWQSPNPAVHPPVSPQEMDELRGLLTSATQARLGTKSAADQARILDAWLRETARQLLSGRRGEGISLIPGFNDGLADFFETQLTDEQRDHLMSLPGDEMQRKLRDLYFIKRGADEGATWKGGAPWRGKRPGPSPPGEPRPEKPGPGN